MMIRYFILSLMIYSRKKYHEDREVRLLTVHLVQFISSTTCGSTRCSYNALCSGVVKFSSCVLSDVIFWWEKRLTIKLWNVCNILFILEKEGETICLMAFVDIVNFQMWRKEYDLSTGSTKFN